MSEDCYTAIDIVKDYEGYLEDLFFSLPMEYSLEEMSYSMWAISELLEVGYIRTLRTTRTLFSG